MLVEGNRPPSPFRILCENVGTACSRETSTPKRRQSFEDRLATAKRFDANIASASEAELQGIIQSRKQ